jgi:hypothetical protein
MRVRRIGMYPLLFIMVALLACAGCGRDGDSHLVVTVADGSNHKLSGVTVVLADSNGAMVNYGTTDGNGKISFPKPPANATVTAAFSCLYPGAPAATNSLDVRYDVNGPVTLHVGGCLPPSGSSTGSSDLGTITLTVANSIPGITQYEVSTNYPVVTVYSGLITQQTITINPWDLQSDGKLSLFVIGEDANGTSLGYGYLLDRTFIDGMTVNITVDQPMSYLQYRITNLPSTADSLCPGVYQGRSGKGGLWLGNCQSISSAATSTTVNVPYIPGLGDQFLYSVDVFSSRNDGTAYVHSSQYLSSGPFSPALSEQGFDLSQALAALYLTATGINTPTPTLSWSVVDPEATMIRFFASFNIPSVPNYYLSTSAMSLTRTSITFPELPDSLAAFRPLAVDYFSVDTMSDVGGIFRSSGGTYFNFPALPAGPSLRSPQSLLKSGTLSRFRDRNALQAAEHLRSAR